jgi:hypothetical protein
MSRDPSREFDDFRDALYAQAELEADKRAQEQSSAPNPGRDSEPERVPTTEPVFPPPDSRLKHTRSVLYDRERGYRVRPSELRTLVDLGKFRVVGVEELLKHAYSGHRDEMQKDLQNLLRQGLIRKGIFDGPEHTPRELLTLTKTGHGLLRANRVVPRNQAIYRGFVRPREANHDADLYPLYQKEVARLEAKGGRPVRVVLDFELQKNINHDFARYGIEARKEIAERHGLRMVRGKIPVPDMRIEYEGPDGKLERIDLELVTEHYRGRSVVDKVRAGFALYTPRGEVDRLRRVLDQQELTAEILSL